MDRSATSAPLADVPQITGVGCGSKLGAAKWRVRVYIYIYVII